MAARRIDRGPPFALASLTLLLLLILVLGGLPVSSGSGSPSKITGAIVGPSLVGQGLKAEYTVNATGGPAVAANGTVVGTFQFNATLAGTDVSSGSVVPAAGVLVNRSTVLTFTAPNVIQVVTLNVRITSTFNGNNTTNTFSTLIQVLPPYVLSGELVAGPTAISGFTMTVSLDGTIIGSVSVPSIAADGTYNFSFDYVPTSLSAGWHTMSASVAPEHGLVTFAGGVEQLSIQFYVTGPPPDYTLDIGIGIAAFAVALFIWGSVVGARRRGRRAR